jgi:hypothetical protein
MNRVSAAILVCAIAAICGSGVAVAQAPANLASPPPPANLGSPPSGSIPILYNDHHVYSKPDVLKQGRVLAALVKNGTLLIPLRSMFEQMGATVSYDGASKTATVSKAGAEVKVTVGKPEVVIDGEARPLDVPPIIYQGNVLVPIRVISEGMGAYVQWVPSERVVVVRYVPGEPPPSPTPTSAAPPPPIPPTPSPVPAATPYRDIFVAGDYIFSPRVYNEFSPGNTGTSSFAVRGAAEFKAFDIPWMVGVNYENYTYPHNCNATALPPDPQCFVNVIGNNGATSVHAFNATDSDFDVRLGVRVLNPHIYFGVGYLWRSSNYGYPNETGFGFGLEKLPDLNLTLSFFGSVWYYPSINGTYTNGSFSAPLGYEFLKYQLGLDYVIAHSPVFLDVGWMGYGASNKESAPAKASAQGPFAGLGIRLP